MVMRLLQISLADLIIAPEEAAVRVTAACRRRPAMRPTGMCQVGETLLVPLIPAASAEVREYLFAPLGELAAHPDEVVAAIRARYYAGFDFIGAGDDGRTRWALFARTKSVRRRQRRQRDR